MKLVSWWASIIRSGAQIIYHQVIGRLVTDEL